MRWEYVTVHFDAQNAFGGNRNLFADLLGGTALGHGVASSTEIDDTLNRFGAEGWELVNTYFMNVRGDAPVMVAIFKRPRA